MLSRASGEIGLLGDLHNVMRTRPIQSSSDPVAPEGVHQSVLLQTAVEMLNLKEKSIAVDATLGGAGHARVIAQKIGTGTFVGFDLDRDAIERAREALDSAQCRIELVQSNFRHLRAQLARLGIAQVDAALFDLGWSTFHLSVGRGFSFQADEPLIMTYEKHPKEGTVTASTIVNTWGEDSLIDIIYGWGEERFAKRIARAIIESRSRKTIDTARELAEVIRAAVPVWYRHARIHPATKTFQALRIAVNDELGALEEGIRGAWEVLSPGGRIAVISFHSIEDRAVKRLLLDLEKAGGRRITKKPLLAPPEELRENPRARSAKLRVIEKI